MTKKESKAEALLMEINKMYGVLEGITFPEPNSERAKMYEHELIDALHRTLEGIEDAIFNGYYLRKEVRIEDGELV